MGEFSLELKQLQCRNNVLYCLSVQFVLRLLVLMYNLQVQIFLPPYPS